MEFLKNKYQNKTSEIIWHFWLVSRIPISNPEICNFNLDLDSEFYVTFKVTHVSQSRDF